MSSSDEGSRRAYWSSQMEAAYAFMMRMLEYPVTECGEPMVSLDDASREAGVQVRFANRPHVRGRKRMYHLRAGQIAGFIAAARAMNRRGWVMQVEDGYRNREIQKYLGREPVVFDAVLRMAMWELDGKVPSTDFMFRRCAAMVATIPKFGTHMSGSAIDITVLERESGKEIDRGGPYLEMSEKTPMASPFVSESARANRQAITAIMREAGFVEYPYEFWHYSSGDCYDQFLRGTGRPAVYGAVEWAPGQRDVKPYADPCVPLNTPEEIASEITAALGRISDR